MFARLTTAAFLCFALTGTAHASEWTVDEDASTLGFTFTQDGKEIEGSFDEWTADITFDPEALDQASAKVVINIDSVDAGSRSRSRSARGKTWFAERDHPTATFETTEFRETGEGAYEADATLTIRGTTQPITLPFTLAFDGDTVDMDGSVSLNRTAFGVGTGKYETGDEVGTDVTVTVDLTATRAE